MDELISLRVSVVVLAMGVIFFYFYTRKLIKDYNRLLGKCILEQKGESK